MSQKNDLLIYVTEYIIDVGNENASGLTKLAVHKLLFLLSRRLKEQGIDMKLPYSWYLYGPYVEGKGYFRATGHFLNEYFDSGDHAVNWLNLRPGLEIAEEVAGLVQRFFSDLIRKYAAGAVLNVWDLGLMIQDAYENYAPYEFQRVYAPNLRKIVKGSSVPEIEEVLDKLLVVFPEDDLEDIYTMYLLWDDTFRLALLSEVSNNDIIRELMQKFWEVFAAKIRCLKNENATDEDIKEFEKKFSKKLEAFQIWLSRLQGELLLNLPESSLLPVDASMLNDLNTVAFNAAVRR